MVSNRLGITYHQHNNKFFFRNVKERRNAMNKWKSTKNEKKRYNKIKYTQYEYTVQTTLKWKKHHSKRMEKKNQQNNNWTRAHKKTAEIENKYIEKWVYVPRSLRITWFTAMNKIYFHLHSSSTAARCENFWWTRSFFGGVF